MQNFIDMRSKQPKRLISTRNSVVWKNRVGNISKTFQSRSIPKPNNIPSKIRIITPCQTEKKTVSGRETLTHEDSNRHDTLFDTKGAQLPRANFRLTNQDINTFAHKKSSVELKKIESGKKRDFELKSFKVIYLIVFLLRRQTSPFKVFPSTNA